MPHIAIDYSPNLEEVIDMAGLCEALREAAAGLEALPEPGLRVRAIRADHVAIADGDPKHGYVDISLRLREGRSLQTRQHVTDVLFAVAQSFLALAMQSRSIALSWETREIDARLAPKTGTIRDHMGAPTSSPADA